MIMKFHYFAPLALTLGTSAQAATPADIKKVATAPNLAKVAASVEGEYLSYSGPFGSRRIVNAQSRVDTGNTTLSLGVSQGTRKADGEKFNATRVTVGVAHDWTSRLSTRTSAGISSNQPVFVTRELSQEVSYKPLSRTVLTLGGRYARYWGGVEALSWSVGAAQYFGGGLISYRFSSFDVGHVGHTTAHLVSAKVEDPYGSNQLWLGHGSALHDAIWLPAAEKGNYTSAEYRRIQPIGGGVGLMVGVNRIWYTTDSTKYHGTGARVGLTFDR
jgi:YaiO family outer membrane protein